MHKILLLIACLSGGLTVAIGAFGAHALKSILEANQRTEIFELAVKYQFYHSLAILAAGLLLFHIQNHFIQYAGYFFLIGIFFFSGSLYILSLTNLKWLGAITPLGGLAFIIGWVLLFVGIYQGKI